jgi:hypothetical protein
VHIFAFVAGGQSGIEFTRRVARHQYLEGGFAGLVTDVYNLGVKPFGEKMHPDLPGSTHFWGYYDLATRDQKYLAGVIVAKRGTPVLLNVTNQLPNKALLPIDPTMMAGSNGLTVGNLPLNRDFTERAEARPHQTVCLIRPGEKMGRRKTIRKDQLSCFGRFLVVLIRCAGSPADSQKGHHPRLILRCALVARDR